MDHRVLGSIPEQCSMCIGQLWPFCTALLGFFFLGFAYFLKKGFIKELNNVISVI
jgi:hypothetical protein